MMGSVRFVADITVDLHDNAAITFATINGLFGLANGVTRDKIKPIKIEFWTDEHKQDAILTYSFNGWISSFTTTSGTGSNHELHLQVQPELDSKNFLNLVMGN